MNSDSSIDVLLFSSLTSEGYPNNNCENLAKIICSKEDARVDSHHDILVSILTLPYVPASPDPTDNITAPRVQSTKHRITWSDEGITRYQELLASTLPTLQTQDDTDDAVLTGSASFLLSMTNHLLTTAAKSTNKFTLLSTAHKQKPAPIPPNIKTAAKVKEVAHKHLRTLSRDPLSDKYAVELAGARFKEARSLYQSAVRQHSAQLGVDRDVELHQLLSKKPGLIMKSISNKRKKLGPNIKSLHVGERVYTNNNVADGFFDHISSLKTLPQITSPCTQTFFEDHRHVIEIARAGKKIPRLSLDQAESLLRKIRPHVADFYSVTAAHYLNGGQAAINYFCFLVNAVLNNIELASLEELNTTHAVILHKGHKKDPHQSSSFRTISSCPFISKAVDLHLGNLSKEDWSNVRAATQFQGEGTSHELAALLLTTAIQHTTRSLNKPAFILLLDARSAFDAVIRQFLVRRLFLDTTKDQRALYWDQRLSCRTTFCQWGEDLMGPIKDQLGVEQGGPNSSEHYKIYNNEQLETAQHSGLGITIGDTNVAAIGQADDTALAADNPHHLQLLLDLSTEYCKKYEVKQSTSKTKLLLFPPLKGESEYIKYYEALAPIHMNNTTVPFSDTAEHVGVIRSVSGNLPHIHSRTAAHRKALAGILSAGLARRHRANPLASLRAEKVFGEPVLFSGVAPLILSKSEVNIIDLHVKNTVQSLLRLHDKTPDAFIFFMAGCLPGEATLHIKQLTLFGMICRLPGNILNSVAKQMILCPPPPIAMSWFCKITQLCFKYNLPHPLSMLEHPPNKIDFKRQVKNKVQDFWQIFLRERVTTLPSLKYLRPQFMSLSRPHPILSTAPNPYEVNKMTVQIRMLSGRYRVGSLTRHFSPDSSGLCELCGTEVEDLPHMLVPRCPLLEDRREALLDFALAAAKPSPVCLSILDTAIASDEQSWLQFVLDCSTLPDVIQASQSDASTLKTLFKITRTWCYSLHRSRLKLLGRWVT